MLSSGIVPLSCFCARLEGGYGLGGCVCYSSKNLRFVRTMSCCEVIGFRLTAFVIIIVKTVDGQPFGKEVSDLVGGWNLTNVVSLRNMS